MGMMIEGRWSDEERSIEEGAFVRPASVYDEDLAADAIAALVDEPGRFHLIASLSCPWSHRTLIVRRLKGLAHAVPVQIAGGPRVEGYAVNGGKAWPVPGTGALIRHLHQLYAISEPRYTGSTTVPLLWDSRRRRIASNESAKIMRAFDAVRQPHGGLDFTLVPDGLRIGIDALNSRLYRELSDAVYRAGLAERQSAYDEAVAQVFAMLDELEVRLASRRYLFGATLSETDWRLWPTLVRFDAVYHGHFKCARRRLVDYPNLWAYARDLHTWHGIAETVDFAAIREGYYYNDRAVNPFGIVATAPDADWLAPHGREALGPALIALRTGGTAEVEPRTFGAGGR
ncbi:MAG: glutathione S-transferase family protein [Alphaproteobacteria bacterium]